jgi:WD40 repeat protein
LGGAQPLIVNFKTREPTKYVLEGHQDRSSTCLALSPDEKTLASCVFQFDNEKNPSPVRLFAADTGKLLATSDAGGKQAYCVTFSPDGKQVAVGCNGCELLFLSANVDGIKGTVQVAAPSAADKEPPDDRYRANHWIPEMSCLVVAIAYAPKADLIAAATKDAVRLIDVKQRKVVQVLGEKLAHVRAIAFSPDGKLLAAAYGTQEEDLRRDKPAGGVLVWEVATGKLLKDLK